MILWEKEKKQDTKQKRVTAQELIDWLLSRRTVHGDWPLDWVTTVAFAELSYSSSHSADLGKSLISDVLNEMSKNGKKTVEDFETIFEQFQKVGARTANQKVSWHFFIPIKVTINSDITTQHPRIRILGKDFSFISLSSVKQQLGTQSEATLNPANITDNTREKVECLPEVFLSVSSQAPDDSLAWKEIEPAFYALRGLIEMTIDFYKGRIRWNKQSARGKVPHPLWMIAYTKGVPPKWRTFVTEIDSTKKMFDLNNAHLTRIKKNAEILKREPKLKSPTVSLIADCLRLYSQAMDARSNHLCFLGFWQLAEAITNSEAVGGKTDKVVGRIAWHGNKFSLKGSGYKETLLALGDKRNKIVHRGINEIIKEEDINILKIACEIALDWLFQVNKSLPTVAHIENYYSLLTKNSTDFEVLRDCVAYRGKQKSQ